MRRLLTSLLVMVMGGAVVMGSVKLMARERARKGEEKREGVGKMDVGREVSSF